MGFYYNRYIRISLINLLLVASIGSILRYKILFSLPFIDQKHLLHGHSHFAFAGWVSQTIMVLLIAYLSKQKQSDEFISYKWILIANLFTAYGMLISFPIQGYGVASILFSTLSVFTFYFFSVKYWKDLNKLSQQTIVHYWFKVALLLGAFSSVGTFSLAFMMANKIIHQNWYLAAVYFYLHFQYNGWFFFACMGLFHSLLPSEILIKKDLLKIFGLFTFAVVPAYFLSTLWLSLPNWIYILVVISSFFQTIAWIYFLMILYKQKDIIFSNINHIGKWLIILSGFALSIKLTLQLGSTIPSLSQLAFGFRPIVIAYLHLVLLGVITLFLLGFIFSDKNIPIRNATVYGIFIFTSGIFLNEFILMLQGIASFSYNSIPFSNELLLAMALIMFFGISTIVITLNRSKKKL